MPNIFGPSEGSQQKSKADLNAQMSHTYLRNEQLDLDSVDQTTVVGGQQMNTASFQSINPKGTFGKRSMSMAHPMGNNLDFDKSPG